jgi:hypothetical protein
MVEIERIQHIINNKRRRYNGRDAKPIFQKCVQPRSRYKNIGTQKESPHSKKRMAAIKIVLSDRVTSKLAETPIMKGFNSRCI